MWSTTTAAASGPARQLRAGFASDCSAPRRSRSPCQSGKSGDHLRDTARSPRGAKLIPDFDKALSLRLAIRPVIQQAPELGRDGHWLQRSLHELARDFTPRHDVHEPDVGDLDDAPRDRIRKATGSVCNGHGTLRDRSFERGRPALAQCDIGRTEQIERRPSYDLERTVKRAQIHRRCAVYDHAKSGVAPRQLTSALDEWREVTCDLLFPTPGKQREHLLVGADSESRAGFRARRKILCAIQQRMSHERRIDSVPREQWCLERKNHGSLGDEIRKLR